MQYVFKVVKCVGVPPIFWSFFSHLKFPLKLNCFWVVISRLPFTLELSNIHIAQPIRAQTAFTICMFCFCNFNVVHWDSKRINTMLCPIKVKSEYTWTYKATSCYYVLDLFCVKCSFKITYGSVIKNVETTGSLIH